MQNNGFVHYMLNLFSHPTESPVAFRIYNGVEISEITYNQLSDDILICAGFFEAHDIFHKHIAILSTNCYDWVVTFWAALVTGNIIVPLNPSLPEGLITELCSSADVDIIIKADDMDMCIQGIDIYSFADLIGYEPLSVTNIYHSASDETVLLLATSGTTGKSKIVELSSKNMIASFESLKLAVPERSTQIMPFFPFFHAGGLASMIVTLGVGKTCILGRGPKYAFADILKLEPGHVEGVPEIVGAIVRFCRKSADRNELKKHLGRNISSILCAGAKLSGENIALLSKFGIKVFIAYGLSESGISAAYHNGNGRFDSIGRPNPGVEFAIADDNELLIRSDSVMKGYYKDPAETAKVLIDGWLHTGDLARCDEDGFYYIIGRKKNIICLSNGENVSPEELEIILTGYAHITECLVYSDGKGICADIFTDNKQAADESVAAYNETVPKYRQIYKINYFDAPLARTGSGKIKRKENL